MEQLENCKIPLVLWNYECLYLYLEKYYIIHCDDDLYMWKDEGSNSLSYLGPSWKYSNKA